MRRNVLAIALLVLAIPTLHAQPAFFEPEQNYYKARGPRVKAFWSVDRTALPEDGVLTATLRVEGAANPTEIVRPDLSKLPEFAERFQIENVPAAKSADVEFVYRLKPRNATVNRLPSLDFYYDSGVKVGNPFRNGRATGIDLVVSPVAKPKPPVFPLIEPERLFQIETGGHVLARQPYAASIWAWAGMILFVLLVSVLWALAWRRWYPDGARLAKLRQNRAMRRATDSLQRAGSAEDVAAAVLGYLRSRCPLEPGCGTPSDVEAKLHSAGIRDSAVAAAFLRRCDEARFSPVRDTPVSLVADARSLLAQLEAAE